MLCREHTRAVVAFGLRALRVFSDSGRDIKLCGNEGVDDHDVGDSGNHDDNIVALMTMMVKNTAVKMARSSKL